jgi:hypothetical protein
MQKSSGAEVDFKAVDRDRVQAIMRDIEAAIDGHDPCAAEVIIALVAVISREVDNIECDLCQGLAAITARDTLANRLAETITEYEEQLDGDESDDGQAHVH